MKFVRIVGPLPAMVSNVIDLDHAPLFGEAEQPLWHEVPDGTVVETYWIAQADGSFSAPAGPPVLDLATLKDMLCADVDAQAETQRGRYITAGSGQAMIYLQKQSQAISALQAAAATPPMAAADGAAAYILLAAEIGITEDPATTAPAVDVFGVARQVVATVRAWLPVGAAIEGVRLKAKAAIAAAATAASAQATHDAVAWPGSA